MYLRMKVGCILFPDDVSSWRLLSGSLLPGVGNWDAAVCLMFCPAVVHGGRALARSRGCQPLASQLALGIPPPTRHEPHHLE